MDIVFLVLIQEEEARALKEKEEESANAEFEKWKGAFSVKEEGTAEEEMQDGGQGLLFDFVEYIKVISQLHLPFIFMKFD